MIKLVTVVGSLSMCCSKILSLEFVTKFQREAASFLDTPEFLYSKHTQLFFGSMDFVLDNLGEPVPEETFTHSHLPWSSIVPYLLHPSTMIHGILPVQSMHLTICFHNFCPSFLSSTS